MSEPLNSEDVEKVAKLARIQLSDAENEEYRKSLTQILGYVEMLNELDTESVEPMAHAIDVKNVFRDDVVTPSLSIEEALQNAPQTDGRYFLVPAILDGGE